MALLTSGTVSAAISSGIVFLCTTALFLSGYVLQQRTLASLREQIREPVRLKHQFVYLPEGFAESEGAREVKDIPGSLKTAGETGMAGFEFTEEALRSGRVIVAEVGAQVPIVRNEVKGAERGKTGKEETVDDEWEGLSRAERRRKIKQDIEAATKADREGYHRRSY